MKSTDPTGQAAGHLPIINANGTRKADLVLAMAEAIDALESVGQLLARTAPNARDYGYGPLLDNAEAVFRRRRAALAGIINELSADMLAIDRMG